MSAGDLGPVVFAYDGSELAKLAIEEAGRQLAPGRDAVVLTVWRPYGVGFVPPPGVEFDAAATDEVRKAAEETAAQGASMAQAAGSAPRLSRSRKRVEGDRPRRRRPRREPDRARLPRQERSLRDFLGSVAAAVAAHSGHSVLIVHKRR